MDNNRYIDAAERIKSSLGAADTAIILGSGLGGLSARLENAASLSYSEIPGFPVSTAPGHAGRIYCGFIGTKAVYCLSGRFHYYEGYSTEEIANLLHIKPATVRTQLKRGRELLKTKLIGDMKHEESFQRV